MDNRIFKKPYKPQFVSTKQYSHAKTFGTAPLPQFPVSLLAPYYIDNQAQKPACTAFSGVDERYGVTATKYDPDKQWQAELDFLGVKDAPQGVELDVKMQVGIKVGFYPVGSSAPQDTAKAYFWVTKMGGMDWFDSMRLSIFQLYQKYGKVIPVTIGVNWYSEWDNTPYGILTDGAKNLLGGHDIEIAGLESFSVNNAADDYLDLPGTWGNGFGDNGLFRVNRLVFNKYFAGFGAAYWSDDPNTPPAKMNLLIVLLQNVITLYKRLLSGATGFPPKPAPVTPPVPPQPQPQPPTPPSPSPLFFDTAANSKISVAKICDELGLQNDNQYNVADTKRILMACIELESGFENYRPNGEPMKHENLGMNGILSSTDWGIVMCNDRWHIGNGKDFPSVAYVLANPEVMVRWMAKLFLTGKADLWSSYKFGGYRKFL